MTENVLQSNCYIWLHNNYPDLRGLLCYNLSNSKNRVDGAKNKALGLQAGSSDMVFYYKSKAYMIEMKTKIGKQSKVQKNWQDTVKAQGFEYVIIKSLEEFQNYIKSVIEL